MGGKVGYRNSKPFTYHVLKEFVKCENLIIIAEEYDKKKYYTFKENNVEYMCYHRHTCTKHSAKGEPLCLSGTVETKVEIQKG